jgi:hypothetical protein
MDKAIFDAFGGFYLYFSVPLRVCGILQGERFKTVVTDYLSVTGSGIADCRRNFLCFHEKTGPEEPVS